MVSTVRKYSKVLFSTSLSLTLFLAPLSLYAAETTTKSQSAYRFDEVLSLLSSLHISGATKDELLDAALQGMIDSLDDPYTAYYEPAKSNTLQNAVNGQVVGLGLRMAMNDKGIYVSEVLPGSPAEQSGLQAGDYLVALGEQQDRALTLADLSEALSGKKEGDTISIMISRVEEKKLITMTFKKIQFPISTHRLLDGNVGYIALYSFAWNTEIEFVKALTDLQSKGMTSLIIDLRNNGGGYIESAKMLAGHFIENGTFMYEKKHGFSELKPMEIKDGQRFDLPTVVLINEHSASASEMFAGFMQDHKLATIVGTRSYGKGVAQQLQPLLSGGMLKVTSMEWLTPKKREVNHVGIEPDILVSGEIEQLIRAILANGVTQIDVQLTDTLARVNQIELPVNVPFRKIEDSYYVPARQIAALAEADIRWDEAQRAVTMKSSAIDVSYPVSSEVNGDVLLMSGTSWIRLDVIQEQFTELTWAVNERGLQLHFKKEVE